MAKNNESTAQRLRLLFSTSFPRLRESGLHVQVPLGDVKKGVWLNMYADLRHLLPDAGAYIRSLASVRINGVCSVRRVLLSRPVMGNDSDGCPANYVALPPNLEFLSITNHQQFNMANVKMPTIPKPCGKPPTVGRRIRRPRSHYSKLSLESSRPSSCSSFSTQQFSSDIVSGSESASVRMVRPSSEKSENIGAELPLGKELSIDESSSERHLAAISETARSQVPCIHEDGVSELLQPIDSGDPVESDSQSSCNSPPQQLEGKIGLTNDREQSDEHKTARPEPVDGESESHVVKLQSGSFNSVRDEEDFKVVPRLPPRHAADIDCMFEYLCGIYLPHHSSSSNSNC